MLLEDFFETVYRPLRLRGKSPRTSILYALSIRSFSKTLGYPARLEDLTDLNVSKHMQRVRDDGRSAGTANKDRAQLLAIWRLAFDRKHVEALPNVQEDIEPERTPLAWMPGEVEALLKAARMASKPVGNIPGCYFWEALLLVCLNTAERIGALMECRWDDFTQTWLRVPAEHRKGGRRDKMFLLSADTVAALDRLREFGHRRIFHWPYHHGYLWIKFNEVLEMADLPTDRKSKFHRLRKTTASAAAAAGLDPSMLLDHTDRRTTANYLDPRIAVDRSANELMARYLRGDLTRPPKKDAG